MPKRLILLFLFLLGIGNVAAMAQPAVPGAFDTKAAQAFMIEASTGTILLAKNEDQPISPASLAKLMTLDVVFDAIGRGEISLDTEYPVSENAWRTGGAPSRASTMFAALKSRVRVGDLIQGVAVQQANDGCIVLAEGISVSEREFARRMTSRARELGMTRAVFTNSTGLPDANDPNGGGKVSLRELVALAQDLQQKHQDLYKYFGQADFTWNKIYQRNKNPLLLLNIGVDGLGLGFTEGEGFSIVASVQRDGRRLFLALGGLKNDKERTEETRRVLEWGLSNFKSQRIFADGEVIGDASVYGGAQSTVGLLAKTPVDVYVPVDTPDRLSARIVYRWPLTAPVAGDYEAGTLRVFLGARLVRELPLYTKESVAQGTLSRRAFDAFMELTESLLFSWLWDKPLPT
ncbi:D-alanyl-D-alanine carboxypeptidase family protein [Rhizobium lusitanum]|jgi:D-alanyl-D-alanine carboxypeptidase (penicillin-binding protein 5/6)|uniref:serine-type D-Ala-D-Ala carboxypeptidase n=2 Tax=Rhizobium TaxID=379 RepID=A0A1C3VHV8_9HYPH|nr:MULTISPECIES: D-alanyl-D-alanine carboxypeptidase family protein [Rhizobium]NKJ05654.1 D-alanyl-D-alanine carboxypeptidase (penicillin-binding protein 5/6) [Rhizobium sp. SG741]NKJ34738.1 D-alanyl-D-alanine carboxypeptidase (penicillin-binding protein 5/6) [Rhizobium sp. SG570]NRP85651.1 D-alanyl-D-alanine carboxypeptidase DacD [Ensifer adhaerens]SCB27278.1 D-alanyl-D-alanine carboxypeptidase (penicillin-binding protein 5/6) [Rhizobium lusitanum]